MRIRNVLLLTLILSSAVFSLMTWPLPKFVSQGIPHTAIHSEARPDREMVHGDHLQLMYRFWLFADFFGPHTPFFHNHYEFNTGDDAARFIPRAHHFPFPLSFKAGELLVSRAFGWNLTMFLSIWLGWFAGWLLLRRLGGSEIQAACASALGMLFPYQWITLCGGSPTGFGMLWPPVIWLGIEMALHDPTRKSRCAGGVLAATAVLFAAFCDSHVFYFTLLFTPLLVITSLFLRGAFTPKNPFGFLWGKGVRLIPVFCGFLLSIAYGLFKKKTIAAAGAGGKRTLHDVELYSINWKSCVSPDGHGYIGWILMLFLVMGLVYMSTRFIRKKVPLHQFSGFLVLASGIGAALLLGYGTEGPLGSAPIILARKVVPMYDMIRQPVKIFCYLPLLIAAVSLLIFRHWSPPKAPAWKKYSPAALCLLVLFSYQKLLRPGLCILADTQGAYAAIAEDSRSRGKEPRLFVLPFWPGNDAWSSLYEHYVSLYRIKMINGYSPVPAKTYSDELFKFFNPMNQGLVHEEHLDNLLERGIDYIILHEEAFPKKVSPRPGSYTLAALLEHPRLQLMTQDQGAWAFKILEQGSQAAVHVAALPPYGAFTRMYEAERSTARRINDPRASGKNHIRIGPGQRKIRLLKCTTGPIPGMAWKVRLKGSGSFYLTLHDGRQVVSKKRYTIDHTDWQWLELSAAELKTFGSISLWIQEDQGTIDIDLATFQNAESWDIEPQAGIFLPAAAFNIHHAYSNREMLSVIVHPDSCPSGPVIDGMFPPLPQGKYNVRFAYQSNAPAQTLLGHLSVKLNGRLYHNHPVVMGQASGFEMTITDNLPVHFAFHFNRRAALEIEGLRLRRTE